jgi:hypothetical protein
VYADEFRIPLILDIAALTGRTLPGGRQMSNRRIFIVHSMDDQPLVDSVRRWLEHSEWRTAEVDDPTSWSFDAQDLRIMIKERIRGAESVIVLWSDRAAKSPMVNYEIGMADALDVPIRVYVAEGTASKFPSVSRKPELIELQS